MIELSFLKKDHFAKECPVSYEKKWITENKKIDILQDDLFDVQSDNSSWSMETEEIHEEPTKNGWIDVYERESVLRMVVNAIGNDGKIIVEFGASVGYMIGEMKKELPGNYYIATDLMNEGLKQSFHKNPDIMHVRCGITDAPFENESIDFVFSLNVLEHIEDDEKAISECYRMLRHGGAALFVVPRGDDLYDYFDEVLFHKRRYSKGELIKKCRNAGFIVEKNDHIAWLCYPFFWLKKKKNRHDGIDLSYEEKVERVKSDVKNGMGSTVAQMLIRVEKCLSSIIRPSFGVRELVLLSKE